MKWKLGYIEGPYESSTEKYVNISKANPVVVVLKLLKRNTLRLNGACAKTLTTLKPKL